MFKSRKASAVSTQSVESKANQELAESELRSTATLQTIIRKGKIKLLKASWLVEQSNQTLLRTLNRQGLEAAHPQAYADESKIERSLREVEASAEKSECVYPALAVVSFCWQTSQHPDPDGSVLRALAELLNWYAAQRSKFTRERLYGEESMKGVDFDVDFCVFIDFWSIYQHPRTPEQGGNYLFAKQGMNVLYGHRATTVIVVSEGSVPKEGDAKEDRGGYSDRGWCAFERTVSSVCKIEGYCLDLGGFERMLHSFKLSDSRIAAVKQPFSKQSDKSLRALALDDRSGTAGPGSCLEPMVAGRQLPLRSPTDLEKQMIFLKWSNTADMAVCVQGYQDVVMAVLSERKEQRFAAMTHWGSREWKQLGGCMILCAALTDLWLTDCPNLGDAGMEVFAEVLHRSCAPQLEAIHLERSGVGAAGCVALAKALKRGAMPALRLVRGIGDVLAHVKLISQAAGPELKFACDVSEGTLTITRSGLAPGSDSGGGPGEGFPSSAVNKSIEEAPGRGSAEPSSEASLSGVRLAGTRVMEIDPSEGYNLLNARPGPAISGSASPPVSVAPVSNSSNDQWVDLVGERPLSLRSEADKRKCGGKCCAVS